VRVHILGINYWPETTGIAVLTVGRAEYLAAQGHAVTVCAAVPYYPEWRVPEDYRTKPFRRELRNGVTILRCPIFVPSRVTAGRRMLHELSFIVLGFLRSLVAPRPQVLFVTSPPLGLAMAARLLSAIWRVPYVFDVADLQPDAALDLGMVKRGWFVKALFVLEKWAYRGAARVTTLTESMRQRILQKGFSEAHVDRQPLWADDDLFGLTLTEPETYIRGELGLGDAFVVLHIGNMGIKQGLQVLIDAAVATRADSTLVYVLVGDGAARSAIAKRVEGERLTNVRMYPLMDRNRLLRMLSAADVTVVTQQRSVSDIVFPSKLVTLLAAGKPVVASMTDGSEAARVVRDAGGVVVEPENAPALVNAIESLRRAPDASKGRAASARAYAQATWHRGSTLDRFERMLLSVVSPT
jgi:colanic acid biosynthesis glycosyl transferase WcaI